MAVGTVAKILVGPVDVNAISVYTSCVQVGAVAMGADYFSRVPGERWGIVMTIITGVAFGDSKGFGVIVMICMTGARAGRLDVVAVWPLVVSTISPVVISVNVSVTGGTEIVSISTKIFARYARSTVILIERIFT